MDKLKKLKEHKKRSMKSLELYKGLLKSCNDPSFKIIYSSQELVHLEFCNLADTLIEILENKG